MPPMSRTAVKIPLIQGQALRQREGVATGSVSAGEDTKGSQNQLRGRVYMSIAPYTASAKMSRVIKKPAHKMTRLRTSVLWLMGRVAETVASGAFSPTTAGGLVEITAVGGGT